MSRTAQDLACAVEPEPGREFQFCPIRQLPIVRHQRVRALPGFHLLSLDAGKEALARGFYDAYGKQFPCQNLEYLHPDDKVFLCPEDHKAFLNQMSMQYHRYICHELEERKEERKRLRARAVERKARSEAHAAQAQQRQQQAQMHALTQALPQPAVQHPVKSQVQPGQAQVVPQVHLQAQPQPAQRAQRPQRAHESEAPAGAGGASSEGASAAALAGADAAAQLLATNDLDPAEEPFTATDDPYATAAAGAEGKSARAATAACPLLLSWIVVVQPVSGLDPYDLSS